ncbi:S-adenosyl-L-methionine-dependent methyltransferase [Armillaria nabsnona]|nr:S-adenosyl-L-methionine-dependent methyltransferase [Armillaria nabsnona]
MLSELVSLIANATRVVEEDFAQSSVPNDDRISSIRMMEAIQTIEGACAQLCALVARLNHTMFNVSFCSGIDRTALTLYGTNRVFGIFEPACMHVAVAFNIADHLLDKPEGLHVSEVGALSGAEPQKLGRNLNCSLVGIASGKVKHLKDPDWDHSDSPIHTPFNSWSKYPGTFFSWYRDESKLRDGATVCDVGGGIGVISMPLVEAHPTLRIVLQDLPAQVQSAKDQVWPELCPAAIETGHVEFKAMNFLVESPVKGCNVYYLKHILHDWPDKECTIIPSGVKNTMGPGSRLLIHEYILQHARQENDSLAGSSSKPAPEPLLPNYGAGRILQYNIDLDMMCVFNSQERRLDQFNGLGKRSGLKFMRVWDLGETGIVEFCLV